MVYFSMNFDSNTSIIIPCKNESGNLISLVESIALILKANDEIIIVEGNSTDSTFFEAKSLESRFPKQVRALKQSKKGKFNAVLTGVSYSKCSTIMIWDADATVNFQQNYEVYSHITSNNVLISGDRLHGVRDKGSMQIANLCGNWFFAILWTGILKQSPVDLLCGTKKFPRLLLEKTPKWLIDLDPFGDFTIFSMAKKEKMSIISIPVHYHARSYGKTNISRWSDGLKLLWITLIIYIRFYLKKFK